MSKRANWRPCASITVCLSAFVASSPGATHSSGSPILELTEVFARTIPDTFALAGAIGTPSGLVVLRALNQSYILILDEHTELSMIDVGLPRPPVGVGLRNDSTLEVVDGSRVVRVLLHGATKHEEWLDLPVVPSAGARASSGWLFAGMKTDSAFAVFYVPDEGEPRWVCDFNRAHGSNRTVGTVHITAVGDVFIATRLNFPFNTVTLSVRPWKTETFEPASDGAIALLMKRLSPAPEWISLPTVKLDRGFIQTLADLHSDARVLLLYNDDGQIVRQTRLDVPMGFIAAIPERHLLIAARSVNQMEVVGYRWSWRR